MRARSQRWRWAPGVLVASLLGSPAVAAEAETEAVADQARRLGAKFRGGKRCVPAAFAELRTLRETYGVQGWVGKSLALAFRGCGDDEAWARLFAALAGPDAGPDRALKLGAAWLRAGRFQEAVTVLEPLAEDRGTRAAWLYGFALFHSGERAEASGWLEGARANVDGAARSDAPIMLALGKLALGDTSAAVAELDGAAERLPESIPVFAIAATVRREHGDEAGAQEAAMRVRTLSRAAEMTQRQQLRFEALREAWSAARRRGDGGDAEPLLERLVEESPRERAEPLITAYVAELKRSGKLREARRWRRWLRNSP